MLDLRNLVEFRRPLSVRSYDLIVHRRKSFLNALLPSPHFLKTKDMYNFSAADAAHSMKLMPDIGAVMVTGGT